MGGSLPYTPRDLSACPLRKGATIAVRLGEVFRQNLDNDTCVFKDNPDEADYGLLKITDIDTSRMTFTIQFFDKRDTTNFLPKSTYTVNENESIDINNDGLNDISYYVPADKRVGYEEARYLTFISDQQKLNTTMFAVIVDQYQHNDYPGGVIGINPNGNMILSKYNSSGSRSVLSTFRNGDYVLDGVEGKYQRIESASFMGAGRAVTEAELKNVEEKSEISYLFKPEEFFGNYDAKNLLNLLDGLLKTSNPTVSDALDDNIAALNNIIKDKALISKLEANNVFSSNSLDLTKIKELLSSTGSDENKIAQINRSVIETLYPNICPKLVVSSSVYTEILPLANVTFGTGDEKEAAGEPERKVLSANQYFKRKNQLKRRYENDYTELITVGVPPFDKSLDNDKTGAKGQAHIALEDTYFSVGINGDFTSSWGNVEASVTAAFFITADTNIKSASLDYEKMLFQKTLAKLKSKVYLAGPIYLGFTFKSDLEVPLKIHLKKEAPMKYRCGFTGLYEAGFWARMEYGWGVDFYSGTTWVPETIAYATDSTSPGNMYLLDKGYINLGVDLINTLGMNICSIVSGDVSARTGAAAQIDLAPNRYGSDLDCWLSIIPKLEISASAFVGLKDVWLIGDIGKGWDWDLYKSSGKPAWSVQLF